MSLQSEDSFDQPLQEVADEPELIFFQITKKTGKIDASLILKLEPVFLIAQYPIVQQLSVQNTQKMWLNLCQRM